MADTGMLSIDYWLADDPAFDQALALIDVKLAAWVGAVEQSQGTLLDHKAKYAPVDEEGSGASAGNAAVGSDASQATENLEEIIDKVLAQRPEELSSGWQITPQQEDESLLSWLDTGTRQKIRVRRRLCNDSKSIRQLLEEIRREEVYNKNPKHNSKPKSWWVKG